MRALAIVLMVIFHFIWDLNHFGYISVGIPNGPFWRELRVVIVTLFLFSMGVSLVYVYNKGIDNKKLLMRMAKLIVASGIITATTMVTSPKLWVYFGILHFIAFATIVCVWFVKKPNTSLVIGLVILGLYIFTDIPVKWPFIYIAEYLPKNTVDIVTILPWLSVPFIGVWAGHLAIFQAPAKKPVPKPIMAMSSNSLIIYLVHQPFFFACFYAYAWLMK